MSYWVRFLETIAVAAWAPVLLGFFFRWLIFPGNPEGNANAQPVADTGPFAVPTDEPDLTDPGYETFEDEPRTDRQFPP